MLPSVPTRGGRRGALKILCITSTGSGSLAFPECSHRTALRGDGLMKDPSMCRTRQVGPRPSYVLRVRERISRSVEPQEARTTFTVTSKTAPPSLHLAARPPANSTSRLRFGPTSPGVVLVPPSWFLTTLAAFATARSRACCIPLTTMGFTAFPGVATCAHANFTLPRRCLRPPEPIPPLQPHDDSHVPPRRFPSVKTPRPRGFAPLGSPSPSHPRCRLCKARDSPGLPVLKHIFARCRASTSC
jgi:hypothetical protein